MSEIKIVIGRNGKVKIQNPGGSDASFTEKLAKDLGNIEERHKGVVYSPQETKNQQEQGQG